MPGWVWRCWRQIVNRLIESRKSELEEPLTAPAAPGLQPQPLRADVAETITCAYLAGVTLAGIGLSYVLGVWWLQYVAAVALLIWLVPETREALEAAAGGGHEDEHHPPDSETKD